MGPTEDDSKARGGMVQGCAEAENLLCYSASPMKFRRMAIEAETPEEYGYAYSL
jgi:hypothetical protein